MELLNYIVYEKPPNLGDELKDIGRHFFPFLQFCIHPDAKYITGLNKHQLQFNDKDIREEENEVVKISTRKIRKQLKKRDPAYEHILTVFEPEGDVIVEKEEYAPPKNSYVQDIADCLDYFHNHHPSYFQSYVKDLNMLSEEEVFFVGNRTLKQFRQVAKCLYYFTYDRIQNPERMDIRKLAVEVKKQEWKLCFDAQETRTLRNTYNPYHQLLFLEELSLVQQLFNDQNYGWFDEQIFNAVYDPIKHQTSVEHRIAYLHKTVMKERGISVPDDQERIRKNIDDLLGSF